MLTMHTIKTQKIASRHILKDCAEILAKAYNSEPWNDEWSIEKAHQKLACFYDSPGFAGFTAYLNDELVGACVGNIEPYYTGDYFYLKEMFVLPEAQQQGIGKQLLAVMKAYLKEICIQQIILFTSNEFHPYRLYEKSGFKTMEGMVMMHFGTADEPLDR